MQDRDQIRAAYDRWSHSYDAQENTTRDLDLIVLQSLVPPLAGRMVVELGCGTGKNLAWLAPRCCQLVGLDFSTGMLWIAKHKLRSANLSLVQCDVTQPVPLAAGLADVVLVSLILEHVASLKSVFMNASWLMAPGAWLIVSEFHPDRLQAGQGARFREGPTGEYTAVGSLAHTREEMIAAARASGLRLLDAAEWSVHRRAVFTGEEKEDDPLILSLRFRKDL